MHQLLKRQGEDRQSSVKDLSDIPATEFSTRSQGESLDLRASDWQSYYCGVTPKLASKPSA